MLYCFECGHESPADGDWLVQVTGVGVDVDCPECGTTITTRKHTAGMVDERADTRCHCQAD